MCRPPSGEARGIERARTQRFQCGGSGGGRGERAGGGPAGQPAEQADEAERVGDGAVAVGHGVERRIGPVQRIGRAGEGLRQAARTVTDRGERGAGGEPCRAERQIERVHPGMGVGEPAGGFGGGHAGAQAVAHRIRGGGGAGVEPGERVGRVAQRDQQAGQLCAGQPGVWPARRCAAPSGAPGSPGAGPVGVGFVGGVLPGRAEQVGVVVAIAEPAFSRHPCASPNHWYHWVSMTDLRRFGRDGFGTSGVFADRPGPAHGRVRTRETGSVR